MKAHKENVLRCGLQEKTHGIVFQFLSLFLTVLLDDANKKNYHSLLLFFFFVYLTSFPHSNCIKLKPSDISK